MILLTSSNIDGNYKTEVWRSLDAAETWTRLSPTLEPALVGLTLDAAPSDPRRLYVTGTDCSEQPTAAPRRRARSTFRTTKARPSPRSTFPGTSVDYPAVPRRSPSDQPGRAVRARAGVPTSPAADSRTVENFLLYSDDGGKTFSEILRDRADFLGFALSA